MNYLVEEVFISPNGYFCVKLDTGLILIADNKHKFGKRGDDGWDGLWDHLHHLFHRSIPVSVNVIQSGNISGEKWLWDFSINVFSHKELNN